MHRLSHNSSLCAIMRQRIRARELRDESRHAESIGRGCSQTLDFATGYTSRSGTLPWAGPPMTTATRAPAFSAEFEMTDVAEARAALLHRHPQMDAIVREQSGALKVPDLVAVTLRDPGARTTEPSAGLSEHEVRVLRSVTTGRAVQLATLSRRSGLTTQVIDTRVVPSLVDRGFVETSRDGRLVRSTGAWQPAARLLTAIELKLANWRRALHQAFRMQRSVDYSWVVLDHAHVAPAIRNVEHFRELGVGLASLSAATGEIAVHHRARAVRHRSPWLRDYFADRVVSDLRQVGPSRKVPAVNVRP